MVKFIFALILFILLPLGCSEKDNTDPPEFSSSGVVIDIPDGVPESGGLGSSAEDAWGFVRQSATWGDANSSIMDTLLVSLMNSGLLHRTGTFTDSDTPINNQSMTIRLTVGSETTVSTASAFTGSKTYSKKFEIWRNSDDAKALELFFDEPNDLGDDGVLMFYNLKVLSPTEFDGDNVIVESYTFSSSDGPKQTYTWSGGAITSGGTGEAGRVVIEDMDSGTLFCFKSVVKFDGTLDWCPAGTGKEYYSLAYTQRLDSSGQVTAKFGLDDGAIDNSSAGVLCSGTANPLNYGLFTSTGFISDSNSVVAADYPPTTRVDTLFGEVGTVGAGAWDDTSKATMDTLDIQFVDTSVP